jgi:cell division protein FtsL
MGLLSRQDEEIDDLKQKIRDLKNENKLYKRAALDWMADFDELKNEWEELQDSGKS